jgi:hypothetical protein
VVDGEGSPAESKKRRVSVWVCSLDDVHQVAFGLISLKTLSILTTVDSDSVTDYDGCALIQLLDGSYGCLSLLGAMPARNLLRTTRAGYKWEAPCHSRKCLLLMFTVLLFSY